MAPWVYDPRGHDIVRRQITRKWYKIELFTTADQQEVVYDPSNNAIFKDLKRPLTVISRAQAQNGYNRILIGTYTRSSRRYRPTCIFKWSWATVSDSNIFNDKEHRAASLRKLNFLLKSLHSRLYASLYFCTKIINTIENEAIGDGISLPATSNRKSFASWTLWKMTLTLICELVRDLFSNLRNYRAENRYLQ